MDSTEQHPENLEPETPDTEDAALWRKRLLWTAVVLAAVLVLLLLPPWLNVNRLRVRISNSMSQALGRPVHMDKVSMHLLPVPGFTLENLVVSEDPAFGDEPVIRAMKVDLTIRPSSLWRRQVEISSIRFEVDDNGSAPSLNLVRNTQGQWNLQGLLMHAAQVNTASNGPAPRFPYVEVTGGRVNVKLGQEKQPFSLIDADFALWLDTPEQWRVRLEGKPVRTDTNASDTGTVSLEGQLQRATDIGDVPVDLRASWHDAPLGEASKLLTGTDAGWRGTLHIDATLFGPLRSAKLTTHLHINDLRRADFVPARRPDLGIECNGDLNLPTAVIDDPSCTVPAPVPQGSKQPGEVVAVADSLELTNLHTRGFGASGLRFGMTNVPDSWLMDWARLFSMRIPANEAPGGIVAGSMLVLPADDDSGMSLQGEFRDVIEVGSEAQKPTRDETRKEPWLTPVPVAVDEVLSVTGTGSGLTLSPLNLSQFAKLPALTLSGIANAQSYSLHLAGIATPQQLHALVALVPPLGDGLEAALPDPQDDAAKPMKLNVTCSRVWGAAPSCSTAPTVKAGRPARAVR